MSLAEPDGSLFARKGEAAPTPFAGEAGATAAFGARRRLALVVPTDDPAAAPPRRVRRPDRRKRFTFRLDADRHAALTAAAAKAGLSRQRFLERALDAALESQR